MLEAWAGALPMAGYNLVHSGYFAVGTFFVLSGFVLARSYGSTAWNRRRLIRYGAGRIARIYPVYLFSLVIVAPIILSDMFRTGAGSPPVAQKAMLLANYGLLLQGWSGTLPVNWNTPAWSLSCELFFYLCFPLAIILLRRMSWTKIVAVAVGALALPMVLGWVGVPEIWKPLIHLSDFLLGITAAGAYAGLMHSRRDFARHGIWLYAPSAVLGILVVAFPAILPGSMEPGSALRPLNALLILGLALGGGFPARGLSTRLAMFLGKASYSLYILHIPMLWWYKRWWIYLLGSRPSAWAAIIFLPIVILASGAAYQLLEDPANRRIRDWVSARF